LAPVGIIFFRFRGASRSSGIGFEGYEFTPGFLAFAPWLLWTAWRLRVVRLLLVFGGLYATAWFMQMHQLKFLIPAFGALALAAGSRWTIGESVEAGSWELSRVRFSSRRSRALGV
jgi:hypothetical protein